MTDREKIICIYMFLVGLSLCFTAAYCLFTGGGKVTVELRNAIEGEGK